MSEIKRAVIYARFSSDMQREESIDAQVRACKEYAKRKGYVVTHIYKDEAKSGRDIVARTEYLRMMEDAKDDLFDVVIFHKVDRNARNEYNYYTFKHTLAQLGIEYEYAVQNIDSSPEGQMMESMLVGFAAYYSRNLAKETKKGLNENAYKALFNGGTPPLGYKIVDQRYEIVPHEAEAVRLIFDLYLAGYGYGYISEELNNKRYTTKAGRPFGKNSLFDILKNEKYIGTYTFNKTSRKKGKRNMHSTLESEDVIRLEDAIPPIINKEDFYRVQEKRKSNRRRSAAYTATVPYLLSGKVFCGQCGSAMGGHSNKPREITYSYYCCLKKERIAAVKCQQKQIRKELLENYVLDVITSQILSDKAIADFAKIVLEEYEKNQRHNLDTKKSLQSEKFYAEKKLNNLYKIIEDGDADEFDIKRIKDAKAELRAINEKLDSFSNVVSYPEYKAEVDSIVNMLKQFKELYLKKSLKIKKLLIDTFVEKVIINNHQVTLILADQSVCTRMVPQTGIEPVRISLSEGF